ncbi:MAG: T9SS C-terminal target domain-containing protein, partial [Bacteroidetes bacterium]
PNPMRDRAVLRFRNPAREALDVTVMSLDGRMVRRYADVRSESLTIERDNLPAGLYFVHFVNPAGQHTATSLMVE